jgi:hypothetical protein
MLTPRKTMNRNFVVTHFAQVNRLSDIYVKPPQRSKAIDPTDESTDERKFSWQEVRNLLLSFVVVISSIMYVALKK